MIAQISGTCGICSGGYYPGDEITTPRKSGKANHLACFKTTPQYKRWIELVARRKREPQQASHSEPSTYTPTSTSTDSATSAIEALAKALGENLEHRVLAQVKDMLKDIPLHNRQLEVKTPDKPEPVNVGIVHKQFEELLNLCQTRYTRPVNIYLYNGTGGGKSHVLPQIAKALNLPYAFDVASAQTPDYRVFGYCDANGNFVKPTCYDIVKNGGIYCIEELDNASADLLVALDTFLANGTITFANGEQVQRHEDCIFAGNGNTPGRGPTVRYPERKAFDAAFASRLFFVEFAYDDDLELSEAIRLNPDHGEKLVRWVRAARQSSESLALRIELTPRASYMLCTYSKVLSKDKLIDGILAGIDQDAREKLLLNCPFPTL